MMPEVFEPDLPRILDLQLEFEKFKAALTNHENLSKTYEDNKEVIKRLEAEQEKLEAEQEKLEASYPTVENEDEIDELVGEIQKLPEADPARAELVDSYGKLMGGDSGVESRKELLVKRSAAIAAKQNLLKQKQEKLDEQARLLPQIQDALTALQNSQARIDTLVEQLRVTGKVTRDIIEALGASQLQLRSATHFLNGASKSLLRRLLAGFTVGVLVDDIITARDLSMSTYAYRFINMACMTAAINGFANVLDMLRAGMHPFASRNHTLLFTYNIAATVGGAMGAYAAGSACLNSLTTTPEATQPEPQYLDSNNATPVYKF